MTNVELRRIAGRRLWGERWFSRLVVGGLLLGFCGSAMNAAVSGVLRRMNVPDWQEYALAVFLNRQNLTTPIPNLTRDYVYQATSSTMLELFLGGIMAGITLYGCAVILRRCLENQAEGWLGAAFGGFSDPFGMLALVVRLAGVFLGWAFVAAALVVFVGRFLPLLANVALVLAVLSRPFYRYRYLWLMKVDHPDWSAGECMRSCRRLMKGNMMQAFRLDLAYWLPIAATTSLLTLGMLSGNTGLKFCGSIASIILGQYIGVSQGFLYRELVARDAERAVDSASAVG